MFTSPGLCWGLQTPQYILKGQQRGQKRFRWFLEWAEDKFFLQVIEEPPRRDAVLDFVLTNKEGLLGIVTLQSSWAALTMKWKGLRSYGQQEGCTAKFSTLGFRRVDLKGSTW